LTNSRAAIMGLSLSLLFLFYILNKNVLNYIFIFVVTVLLLYLFEPFSRSLIDLYLRLETVSQRHYLWQAGIDIMKDYPIIGVGPEVYPDKFYSYLPTSASYFFNLIYIVQKPHPHNYSLWLITEMGILGWISSISIFGIYFYMASKLLYARKKNKDELYLFSLGLFAVGILVFVRSFFEVEGVFSYGYISRDLSFWISYIILAFLYKNQNTISALKK
jgi:O-antigen ligase